MSENLWVIAQEWIAYWKKKTSRNVLELLPNFSKQTIILISHNIHHLVTSCDRILWGPVYGTGAENTIFFSLHLLLFILCCCLFYTVFYFTSTLAYSLWNLSFWFCRYFLAVILDPWLVTELWCHQRQLSILIKFPALRGPLSWSCPAPQGCQRSWAERGEASPLWTVMPMADNSSCQDKIIIDKAEQSSRGLRSTWVFLIVKPAIFQFK